jgi:hypothetical protein
LCDGSSEKNKLENGENESEMAYRNYERNQNERELRESEDTLGTRLCLYERNLMFFGNLRVVGVNEGNYELLIEKLMNFK